MNLYEKVVILNPDLDDNTTSETIDKIKNIIIKQGGEILKTENWGRRKMAYELNRHEKGNYFLLLFKSPPSTILELEKLYKVVDAIIKFMVVKITRKKQIESVMASLAEAEKKAASDAQTTDENNAAGGEETPAQEETKDV
ncbi:MAG: 30S ribosomal protein S6 [Nitrospiraceae bacterium]|nr:MAG: 30S ribosomal protein S6 [Nitrospiraceae bacterium]UCH46119.1 MAG: 30S ribosomal protein S6 [Nitrospiraceae bacterium]